MATLPKFFDELAGDTLIYLLGDLIVTFAEGRQTNADRINFISKSIHCGGWLLDVDGLWRHDVVDIKQPVNTMTTNYHQLPTTTNYQLPQHTFEAVLILAR